MACAVAAALPCVAGDAPPKTDTVVVQSKSKSAPAEENIGFVSGLALGAVAGGPVGAMVGGIAGALLGEHYHKQKVANHELAADLSGSNADKAQLAQTVKQLDSSLDHARELTVNITFRTGDAHLTPQDVEQLTTLGLLANGISGVKIQVSGFADPRGSAQYNAALSKQRAESVAAVLMDAGLAQDRIDITAQGAAGASATGDLDGYAFQRRVSVKLLGPPSSTDGDEKVAGTVAQVQ
ncbi:MAG TPA: OmpA family protein [Steroidobacteraceae bacterium]|nr:OmpA family protein [Steroidobacteraceae bacterium]